MVKNNISWGLSALKPRQTSSPSSAVGGSAEGAPGSSQPLAGAMAAVARADHLAQLQRQADVAIVFVVRLEPMMR